ncbi:MAG: MBL fold metallo-hydrolase, partial [Solirubrobacterales bacterium]
LAGQVPGLPVEPLTWLAGTLAAYIAQIARWLSAPTWAQIDLSIEQPLVLVGAYAGLAAAVAVSLRWLGRRTALRSARNVVAAAAVAVTGAALAVAGPLAGVGGEDDGVPVAPGALRVTVLDVGQGDSILLEPGDGAPVLVDAGPPQAEVAATLRERGVDRLGALVATHPESDHVGGIPDVLDRVRTDRLVYAAASPDLLGAASAQGAAKVSVAAGSRLRSGALRLRVLWPPGERLQAPSEPGEDPNELSIVMLAQWHDFDLLLAGDAEAELAPVDPGPIEVLKVAHHGSEDAGLARLLQRAAPQLAVLSVGADNPFGHPSPATLSGLADAGVAVARTDLDGSVVIEVNRRGFSLGTEE